MTLSFPGPEEPVPPYGRTGHPYFLYDMIHAQPESIAETVRAARADAAAIPPPPDGRSVLFVGLGTSFHAALAAEHAARAVGSVGWSPRAADAFELFVEPALVARAGAAVVFSSSGETAVTIAAQRTLRAAGVPQIVITGTPTSTSAGLADHRLLTRGAEEKAWVHTVSYTTAVAAALALLARWTGAAELDPAPAAGAVRALLDAEPTYRGWAERLDRIPKIVVLGSGPAAATAREAALKLREGAARSASAVGVEEFLHGVLPSVDGATAVVATAIGPTDATRARTAVRAAATAGAAAALFARDARPDAAGPVEFPLPALAAPLTPIVDIVPFQLLTYYLAVHAGRNPDVMGYDDPRILAGRRTYGI